MKKLFLLLPIFLFFATSAFAQLSRVEVEEYFKSADLNNIGRVYIGLTTTKSKSQAYRVYYWETENYWKFEYDDPSKFDIKFNNNSLIITANKYPFGQVHPCII